MELKQPQTLSEEAFREEQSRSLRLGVKLLVASAVFVGGYSAGEHKIMGNNDASSEPAITKEESQASFITEQPFGEGNRNPTLPSHYSDK